MPKVTVYYILIKLRGKKIKKKKRLPENPKSGRKIQCKAGIKHLGRKEVHIREKLTLGVFLFAKLMLSPWGKKKLKIRLYSSEY